VYSWSYCPVGGQVEEPRHEFDGEAEARRDAELAWVRNQWGSKVSEGEKIVLWEVVLRTGPDKHLATFDGGWSSGASRHVFRVADREGVECILVAEGEVTPPGLDGRQWRFRAYPADGPEAAVHVTVGVSRSRLARYPEAHVDAPEHPFYPGGLLPRPGGVLDELTSQGGTGVVGVLCKLLADEGLPDHECEVAVGSTGIKFEGRFLGDLD
jgi:hypothetical protein